MSKANTAFVDAVRHKSLSSFRCSKTFIVTPALLVELVDGALFSTTELCNSTAVQYQVMRVNSNVHLSKVVTDVHPNSHDIHML